MEYYGLLLPTLILLSLAFSSFSLLYNLAEISNSKLTFKISGYNGTRVTKFLILILVQTLIVYNTQILYAY